MSEILQLIDFINSALGRPLAVDWALLILQIALFAWILVSEATKSRNRNLYAVVVAATMLLLVQGQAWWMLGKLQNASYVQHLLQLVTLDGARLANLYMALATTVLVIVYLISRRHGTNGPKSGRNLMAPLPVPYVLISGWVLVTATILILLMGGISQAIATPGRSIPGQTLPLLAVGMGKLPLLNAVTNRQRPGYFEVVLFLGVFVLTLLNSRLLALFMVLQLALLWNYRRAELSRKVLVAGLGAAGVILVGFGLYRDLVSYFPAGTPLDGFTIDQFRSQRTPGGFGDWFYGANVEGFAGLAGILTFTLVGGGLHHDFGLSTLSAFTQLVPNAWRDDPGLPFAAVAQWLAAAYPYRGSVVPPGFELGYAHFGLFGILLLGAVIGYLAQRLHKWMRGGRWDPLLVGLLSIQTIQLIRGTFSFVLVTGLADLIGVWLYRSMTDIESGMHVLPGASQRT